MKTIYSFIACLSVLAVAASCQQFVVDTQMSDEEYANHIELVCSAAEEYNLPAADPQSFTFNVSSNAAWTISGAPEWLAVTPASSSASSLISDVTVSAQPNTTSSDRSATLTIKNDKYNTASYTVVVKQLRHGGLFVQPVPQSFEGAGGTLAFTIESNYDWKVRTSETWLTIDKTSGSASSEIVSINATAAMNEGVERYATVTVSAGPQEESFQVVQRGVSFRIVAPESATIDRLGGELVVEIDTPLSWTIKGDNDAFAVEAVDATHFKVSAPFNNIFKERSVKVTAESKIGKEEIVISQDCNFTLENCELLEDGSIKLTGDNASKFYAKDGLRYFETKVVFGDKEFGDHAQFWVFAFYQGGEMGNWLRIGNNTRFRYKAGSVYTNVSYSITKDQMNAATEYVFRYAQNPDDYSKCDVYFGLDGTEIASSKIGSPYYEFADPADFFWGMYAADSASGWCIVKSCDITVLPESK